MTQVTLSDFSFQYAKAGQPTLSHLNLAFPNAQFNLLIGPSGSGKTTLLKFIAGLYPQFIEQPASGQIYFDDQVIDSLTAMAKNHLVGMVFQNPNQQFAMDTVENELTFVLENMQVAPEKMNNLIDYALDFCGGTSLKNRLLNTLSGGEKQRVALACIVAMDPAVIVLDEPFASIDPHTRQDLIEKLKQLQLHHQKTIILADHDLSDYADVVDQVFELDPQTHQLSELNSLETQQRFERFNQNINAHQAVSLPNASLVSCLTLNQFSLAPHGVELITPTQFDFYQGQTTLITGENGIGKSTLFAALTNLINYQGNITYLDHNIAKLKAKSYALEVSLLFQDAENQFLSITVGEELALAKKYRRHFKYSDAQIQTMLDQLGLAGRETQVVYSLSEGQKKKLQIIVMLIMASPVLLLDEPLKGLDLASVKIVVELLQQAKHLFNQTQIIISHQLTGLAPLIDLHVLFKDHQLTYQEVLG